jgi:SAM-dependent methyltransferase
MLDAYIAANRALWNDWLATQRDSDHHRDVARFQATGSSLRPIERRELGDLAGASLLHLQCNMGCDALSWARLGARVTGVDLSDTAIERARALATESGLDATFIRADLYDLPSILDERFDLVYTTYGALCWLPDVARWAEVAARYVRPGGSLYILDIHPISATFEQIASPDCDDPLTFRAAGPYFSTTAPTAEDASGATVYTWPHSLGEVVSALLAAGLHLDFLHEHPVSFWRRYPALVQRDDGYWHWPEHAIPLPLLFSIKATRSLE